MDQAEIAAAEYDELTKRVPVLESEIQHWGREREKCRSQQISRHAELDLINAEIWRRRREMGIPVQGV